MKIEIGVPYTRTARCVAGFIVFYAGIMIGCLLIILLLSGANHLDRGGLIGMLVGGAIPIAYVTYLMFPATLVLEGLQNKPLNAASDMILASINMISYHPHGHLHDRRQARLLPHQPLRRGVTHSFFNRASY